MAAFEHICQVKGRTSAVFVHPDSCCKKKVTRETSCTSSGCCSKKAETQRAELRKKKCCEDHSHFLQAYYSGTPNEQLTETPITAPVLNWHLSETWNLPWARSAKTLLLSLYKPPPEVFDLRVLYQSFLC
jgi:hypothetical protein